jgi:hypothetical protein
MPHAHLLFSIAEFEMLGEYDLTCFVTLSAIVAGEEAAWSAIGIFEDTPRAAVSVEVAIQFKAGARFCEVSRLKSGAAWQPDCQSKRKEVSKALNQDF